jgi:hypothetical protein
MKKGKGILYLSNGEYFQGMFEDDVIQGEGMFFKKNKEIFKGIWN